MSEFTDFAPLTDAIDELTGALEPGERRKLASRMGTGLRTANAKRIKANVTPAGEPMAPRKEKPKGKRRGGVRESKPARMFQSAGTPRYLRKQGSADQIEVGYAGAMARIMRVHQFGLRDTVTRDPASPAVTYDARPTIGLTPDDRLDLLGQVTDHLATR